MSDQNSDLWWSRTRNLMFTMLFLWAVFGYVVHMFVNTLNETVIFGFPLGFYMAAQGSLIVFVIMLFWFAARQDSIDRQHGMAEED